MLSQLASLSALAEQTAHSFPDIDDPNDFDSEGGGDQTVLRPAQGGPAGPGGNDQKAAGDSPVDAESGAEKAEPETTGNEQRDAEVEHEEPEIDGDATVLVSPGDLPAGTAHLADRGRDS